MTANKTNKLSNWLLWAPLKFSFLSFGLIFLMTTIHTFVLDGLFSPNLAQNIFFILTVGAFIYSIIFMIKRLPVTNMDRQSFVSLHIAQTLITSLCFYLTLYIIVFNSQTIMFKLMTLEATSITTFIFAMILFSLFTLYAGGIYFANLYAKIRRIQHFNVPTWKIIFSIPFGFTSLWLPGFLLNTNEKKMTITSGSKHYNKFINWTLANNINTISVFIFITLLSVLFFGFTPVLLTFIFALIYGIWVMQIGHKNFAQGMPGKYATYSVIANIAIILITLALNLFAPTSPETITININDTNTPIQITQD